MKLRSLFLKTAAAALSGVMLLTGAGVSALAAEKTPKGYIEENIAFERQHRDVIYEIFEAILRYEPSINISKYNIQISDAQKLFDAVAGTFPEVFYLSLGKCSYNYYSDGTIYNVFFGYSLDKQTATERLQAFYDQADYYLSKVDDSMDDYTKAVILHDELVLNTFYQIWSTDGQTYSSNYTYMVEYWGRCENYAEIYAYLLAQCGIRSEIVNSDPMGHEWMKIELDGAYYNIDITWDDPTPNREGRVSHEYFLFSDEKFQSDDMPDKHYDYETQTVAADNYDGFDNLHGFGTRICYVNGGFYAIGETAGGQGQLVKYDRRTDEVTVLKTLNDSWSAGGYSYWVGNYSSLEAWDGLLYYNTPDAVYSYDPLSGETVKFADNTPGYDLYGLRVIDGKLYGVKAEDPNVSGTLEYLKDMPETVLTGDANGDGEVDIADATWVQYHIAELWMLEGKALKAADFNGDGQITVDDVTAIQVYINL